MARKNRTPEESARREKIRELLQMANIDSMDDIQNLFSDSTVSRITDKILPVAREWQQRPLESIYAVVFLDAIRCHVRSGGPFSRR